MRSIKRQLADIERDRIKMKKYGVVAMVPITAINSAGEQVTCWVHSRGREDEDFPPCQDPTTKRLTVDEWYDRARAHAIAADAAE